MEAIKRILAVAAVLTISGDTLSAGDSPVSPHNQVAPDNLTACALAGLCETTARVAHYKVIANASVGQAQVSMNDLRAVFLCTKTSLRDGSHVVPVLEKSGPVHEVFLKECIGKTDAALLSYYRSVVFTGKGLMPKTLNTDAEVVAYVSRTKGAIGYIGGAAASAGVKALEVR